MSILGTVSANRTQYLVYFGISLLVLGFAGILYFSNRQIFDRFFGKINPLIAFPLAIGLGFLLLTYFLSNQWFIIFDMENLKWALRYSGLALLLGLIMILVDTRIRFPADTNIFFPESLLFYPAIGFLAEILFHVVPMGLFLFFLNSTFKNPDLNSLIWVGILLISLIEPVYHMTNMAASNSYPLWGIIYVGVHVFIINFVQLLMFRKFDFISMYSFRLTYYLVWHIGWGYIRLIILF